MLNVQPHPIRRSTLREFGAETHRAWDAATVGPIKGGEGAFAPEPTLRVSSHERVILTQLSAFYLAQCHPQASDAATGDPPPTVLNPVGVVVMAVAMQLGGDRAVRAPHTDEVLKRPDA